ncbi:serine hydrolase domain-containing protein [uncultured Maricaulis sp.]|mgnify:CR=1 FL=1|uniref:serine hydrolase domain-containing protein n=1 Tax=uncultured Maricaulis sp. TaxID=174710 RepID=UPI0030DBF0A4|tara:strand:+ start:87355 stop:88650 length:1296 start_codon:yes stop_codon:yes gene_type:complete
MLLRSVWAGAAFALLALAPGCSQPAEPAQSAAAHADAATSSENFDPTGLARFDAAFQDHADRQVRAGYAAILIRNGETHIVTAGVRDVANGEPMLADTQVRLASMTKPVTAVAVMMLVESGDIALDDPVANYIPAFAATRVATSYEPDVDGNYPTVPQASPITIRELLTHTGGVGYIFDNDTSLGRDYMEHTLYQGTGDLAEKINQLAALPLYAQPGERWIYSYSNDILGRVVEVASGMPFQDFLQTRLFDPLGMTNTTFFVTDAQMAEAATLYLHGEDGQLHPAYSPDNPEYRPSWASGGGGLISTAMDYSRFASMLLGNGRLGDVTILRHASVAMMTSNHVAPSQMPPDMAGLGYGFGVGIALAGTDDTPALGIPGDYSWGGLFDTDFFVSPSTGLVAVMMTQEIPTAYMPEGRTRSWWRSAAYATLPQ